MIQRPRVLFISPYCFGLEESMAAAFERAGCPVSRVVYDDFKKDKKGLKAKIFEWQPFVRAAKRALSRVGLLNPILRRQLVPFNSSVLETAARFRPELVFVVKGETLFPETLRALGREARLVSYHWDDPFLGDVRRRDRTNDLRWNNLLSNYPLYQATFVYDAYYIPHLAEVGAPGARYLMDWFELEIFRPMELSTEDRLAYGSDVAFVGSPYANRLELFRALTRFKLGIWGPKFRWAEWCSRYPEIARAYRGEARAREAVKIYNASKIALNIHDEFQCFTSVNNRTFQILASGCLELVDDRPKVRELFRLGEEIDSFSNVEDLARKIELYLGDSRLRSEVARRGLERARGNSGDDRVAQVLAELGYSARTQNELAAIPAAAGAAGGLAQGPAR